MCLGRCFKKHIKGLRMSIFFLINEEWISFPPVLGLGFGHLHINVKTLQSSQLSLSCAMVIRISPDRKYLRCKDLAVLSCFYYRFSPSLSLLLSPQHSKTCHTHSHILSCRIFSCQTFPTLGRGRVGSSSVISLMATVTLEKKGLSMFVHQQCS